MNELNDFVERYVAVWNETDSARRRERIAALWQAGGAHVNSDTRLQRDLQFDVPAKRLS